MLTSVANGFVDKFGKIVGSRRDTFSSTASKKVSREMDRAKELYAEMVRGCLLEHKDPDIAILQRIAPDLELDKENILQVFQDDLALARDTIKAAKGFAKNHSKIEAIYSGHEATDEKSYFASCSEERTSIADRLKELNREKADYTRACHLKSGHSVVLRRGVTSQRSLFPGGREEIFEIAGVSDPEPQSKANTKG